jgi:hypothetical protein
LKTTTLTAALICLLATACARVPEAPPSTRVDIGVHVVSFRLPEGWEHLDHGREHRFHRELSRISVSDHGPVVSEGYLRELRRAHELFRDHRLDDARAQASGLDLRPAFPDVDRRKAFFDSWWTALDGGRSKNINRGDAEVAWEYVLREIERLPEPELDDLVDRLFPLIETAAHREIAERVPSELDGRPAIRLETWDRLTHDHRQSFLVVLNEGNLFVLRMERGTYAQMKPAFETLAGSLAFHSVSTAS